MFLVGRTILLIAGARLAKKDGEKALISLIQAQYAGAFLDFAGLPFPDPRKDSHELMKLTATIVIRWLGRELYLSEEAMTDLRRRAIFGRGDARKEEEIEPLGLQAGVLSDLVVPKPPVYRGFLVLDNL